ncbi:heme-binding protein [Flagellimonas sp. CMM7]|uniref:GlcG/HbpS family heme-binding protein n=1 Tax=Flagellimonas sp. CMM7 TaxID=2654676 RepID=UPI0013D578B2|nr:heme-binding protein [Flagellimonas sp. CMM7]UII80323.1 heme-binding protein [Flagellimonas sp. CMM7]
MKILKTMTLAAVLSIAGVVNAQVEQSYTLTLEGAKKVMKAATDYAKANNSPGGAIAITDEGGHVILLERLTGTFPAASEVSIGKARTAATFTFESKKLEDAIIGGRTSLITVGHNMLRGGIPLKYKGQVVGAIGVSGAASADQDVEIAKAGAAAKFD